MRREANLWRGAILSPIPGEGGLQPIVCCQPARSGEGCFSGCVARLFFSGCVARLFFWLCRQVIFLVVWPGCFSGCVARFITDCVVRLFLAGFARVRFLTFVIGVIAQDRASQISSKSNSSGLQGDSIFLFIHR